MAMLIRATCWSSPGICGHRLSSETRQSVAIANCLKAGGAGVDAPFSNTAARKLAALGAPKKSSRTAKL